MVILVIILKPILGTFVVLHLKVVHEELLVPESEMLSKNIMRHRFVWVEISIGFFFVLMAAVECLCLKLPNCLSGMAVNFTY